MNRFLAGLLMLTLGTAAGRSADASTISISRFTAMPRRGFSTPHTTTSSPHSSSDGSPAWTRSCRQHHVATDSQAAHRRPGRYFLLGNFGNAITPRIGRAADYKASDLLGIRFGKVKTPSGLFNEIQDIDPSYMWSLLPQKHLPHRQPQLLPRSLRRVVYGTLKLGQKMGKLEYRGWGGERSLAAR